MTKQTKIYIAIANEIIASLKKGVVPWQKPWKDGFHAPANLMTYRPYRGSNRIILSMNNFRSHYFLTYQQAKNLGGGVRRGETGIPVVFWNWIEKTDVDEKTKEEKKTKIPLLRTYTVFNVEQCFGLQSQVLEADRNTEGRINSLHHCRSGDNAVEQMPDPPTMLHGGDEASYNRKIDTVRMPIRHAFVSDGEYFHTFFHELVHSTGHPRRLNRPPSGWGGPVEPYSKEELIAEMGAGFVCGSLGIDFSINQSASYIDTWIRNISGDKSIIFKAACAAQKAADFILNVKSEYSNDEEDGKSVDNGRELCQT